MTKPITPGEVSARKTRDIPSHVINAFNDLILQKFDGRKASFTQDEIVKKIMEVANPENVSKGMVFYDFDRDTIFTSHWLDVEDIFREVGWVVKFDNPGYCEDYRATFTKK